jgi:predicted lipid-binding transport protein (Tim44 family)
VPATHEQQTKPDHRIEIQPAPKPRTSKGLLAAGLAMLACLAACTLPLLLAGGLAAGLGALFNSWNVAAVMILVATAGGAVIWQRRKQTTSRAAAATGAICGCEGGGC